MKSIDKVDQEYKQVFTRRDFVRFDTSSAKSQGNYDLVNHLKKLAKKELGEEWANAPELEKWEEWKAFPEFPDVVNTGYIKEGRALKLLAWLVVWFGDIVAHSKLKEQVKTYDSENVFGNMTLDDLVFAFVQVQHNIDYWTLAYRAYENKNFIQAWKDKSCAEDCESERKSVGDHDYKKILLLRKIGNEYPQGSGVSGTDGIKRYQSMTVLFYRAYYKQGDGPLVPDNHKALRQAVEDQAKFRKSLIPSSANVSAPTAANTADQSCQNEELAEIEDEMWNRGVGVIAV